MKLLRVLFASIVIFGRVFSQPAVAAAPPVACINDHCDTLLDINHADIIATLIGCDAQKGDRVLVNGKREDGVLWTLFGITPAVQEQVDPLMANLLEAARKPIPTTYAELRFRLKPGYYDALNVSVGNCSFVPIQLTTGDSGNRHVTLIDRTSISLSPTNSDGFGGVYGYAPLPALQITLSGNSVEQPLVARSEVVINPLEGLHGEDYMYFFDAVKPGRYTMTVSGYGWSKSLGEVNLSRAGEVVRRYIHNEELGLSK